MHSKSITIITGTLRSGLKVLSSCYQLLGFPNGSHIQPNPWTINSLLLQDLGCHLGPLPMGWQDSEASKNAKERINNFLSKACSSTSPNITLQVTLNPLTVPLWLDAFQAQDVRLKLVHIIRHPHEVALSLQANYRLELSQAHFLWLTHIRAALRALEGQDYSLITFDQLLADPVSTLDTVFDASLPTDLLPGHSSLRAGDRPLTSDLLDFVQPSLKHHHTRDLSEPDKKAFAPFARFYEQLRSAQYFSSAQTRGNLWIQTLGSSDSGLIDTLLSALGQQNLSTPELTNNYSQITEISSSPTPHLQAEIILPSSNKQGHITQSFPLLEGQWQKIELSVPEPELLSTKPVKFNPLDKTGIIYISAIHFLDKAQNKIFWKCNNFDCFEHIKISGKNIKISHRNHLALAVLGDDSRISIDVKQTFNDCPLYMVVWIKVSTKNADFDCLLNQVPGTPTPEANKIKTNLTDVLKYMTNSWSFHEKYKARSAEFKKISTQDDQSLIKSKTFWGAPIYLLPQNEDVSSSIYSFGLLEIDLCYFFTDYLFHGATVLDVGAHIGLFSMLSSELTGDTGTVFSFEPTPSTREALELNLKCYEQAVIVPNLAWDENVELDFHDFGTQFSAFNTATSGRLSDEQKTIAKDTLIKVQAITLDDFCLEKEIRPDLIKIDAESSEIQVLKGMRSLMDKVRPVVTIEVGDMESTLKDGIHKSSEILEFAIGYDYLPVRPIAGRYEFHVVKDHYDYDNIIMVPREKLPVRMTLGSVVVQRGRFF